MKISRTASTVLRYIVLLAIVGYFVFAAVRVIRPAEDVPCMGVDIQFETGADISLVPPAEVTRILSANGIELTGMPFRNIDVGKIDSLLMSNPYIDTAVAYPNSVGKLCIRLRVAQPLLHIIPSDGKEFYLDSEGKTLPGGGQNMNLCVVTGKVSPRFARESLLALGKFLRDDPYWGLQVQQINVTPEGELQLVPRTGDHLLILGDTADIAGKLGRVRVFYEKGLPQAGWNTYKTINAEYDGQLVCTRR